MGLKTRLALARTLVFTGLQTEPRVLADVVRQLCRQRADLIVVWQPDAIADDLTIGYRAGLEAMDGRAVLGVRADARSVATSSADLVVSEPGTRAAQGHQSGLAVVVADSAGALRTALGDGQIDGVVIRPDLVAGAVWLAPPVDPSSTPWFVMVDSVASGRSAVQAGARRLAFDSADGAGVRGYRELLDAPWRDEMEQVGLGAFDNR